MALDSLRLIAILPVSPERLYAAWLDSEEHAKFTGDAATSEPGVGGSYTAWGGYISGRHVELEPARRIVQAWRTTEFAADAEDSRLELVLEPVGDGTETKVTLIHTNIPEGQGAQYKSGWGEHYFEPMRAYFSEIVESAPAPKKKASAKAAPKKAASAKKAAKKAAAPKKAPKKTAKKTAAPKKKAAKKTAAPKKKAATKTAAPKKKASAPKKGAKKAKPKKSARR